MFAGRVIRKCIIPATAFVVEAKAEIQNDEKVCRPSELPIYTPDTPKILPKIPEEDNTPGVIENAFRTTRVTLNAVNEDFQAYKRVGLQQFDKSRANIEWLVTYLQEEDNTLPKAGAIGIGALTGLIFGLRGGIFKRTLYATTGALGMGALCYPKEASEYSQVGIVEAKKYFTIAYNFIYGVRKDDPPLELPSLPKLPTTFSEAWDSVKSTATSFVSDGKEEQKPTEQVTEKKCNVKDPLEIVTDTHDTAISKSCHCPIGACLGHSDENPPPKESGEASEMSNSFSNANS